MKTFPADVGQYKQLGTMPPHGKLLALHQRCCAALAMLAGRGVCLCIYACLSVCVRVCVRVCVCVCCAFPSPSRALIHD